ncbi:MAG: hypothetical protein HRT90_04070 [Candidatus Margulisbacteria bacterium]|nr:hypothetical protein [Candidatus Margulisiibacteriota bacterium]
MSNYRIYGQNENVAMKKAIKEGRMFEIKSVREYTICNIPVTPLNLRINAHFGRVFPFYGVFKKGFL